MLPRALRSTLELEHMIRAVLREFHYTAAISTVRDPHDTALWHVRLRFEMPGRDMSICVSCGSDTPLRLIRESLIDQLKLE